MNWLESLRLPLIAAPMFRVTGPELVVAACRAGVVGAFPTLNARSPQELDEWLTRITAALAPHAAHAAPWCPNLIIGWETARLNGDVDAVIRHGARVVITSVGSPAPVIAPLHEAGCAVFADVATIRHARRAIDAGADGLVLLTAGAGGQTGWLNGFAFVRAVRAFFSGPIVLAGGIADGAALWAARALGCDLGYMGTRFIATVESMARPGHKQMLAEASADDVLLTRAVNGLPTSILRPSLVAAGIDPKTLDESITPEAARALFSARGEGGERPRRWVDIWGAGHSVSGVTDTPTAEALIVRTEQEYRAAQATSRALLADPCRAAWGT